MITTQIDENTQFYVTEVNDKKPTITPLQYKITQNGIALARFATQQEMDNALQKIKTNNNIITKFNPDTKFFLTQIDITTISIINTRLQYEILQNNTVLARFTTQQERNNTLSQIAENKPKQQMFLIINSGHFTKDKHNNNCYNIKIPVTLTGKEKYIQNELHYEVIINSELHYVSKYSITDSN